MSLRPAWAILDLNRIVESMILNCSECFVLNDAHTVLREGERALFSGDLLPIEMCDMIHGLLNSHYVFEESDHYFKQAAECSLGTRRHSRRLGERRLNLWSVIGISKGYTKAASLQEPLGLKVCPRRVSGTMSCGKLILS